MQLIRIGTLVILLTAMGMLFLLGGTTPPDHAPDPSTSASVAPRPGRR